MFVWNSNFNWILKHSLHFPVNTHYCGKSWGKYFRKHPTQTIRAWLSHGIRVNPICCWFIWIKHWLIFRLFVLIDIMKVRCISSSFLSFLHYSKTDCLIISEVILLECKTLFQPINQQTPSQPTYQLISQPTNWQHPPTN